MCFVLLANLNNSFSWRKWPQKTLFLLSTKKKERCRYKRQFMLDYCFVLPSFCCCLSKQSNDAQHTCSNQARQELWHVIGLYALKISKSSLQVKNKNEKNFSICYCWFRLLLPGSWLAGCTAPSLRSASSIIIWRYLRMLYYPANVRGKTFISHLSGFPGDLLITWRCNFIWD